MTGTTEHTTVKKIQQKLKFLKNNIKQSYRYTLKQNNKLLTVGKCIIIINLTKRMSMGFHKKIYNISKRNYFKKICFHIEM